jgi:NAD(P)-dependent dehydrogenase (short-subunit alcohol dehydrogenase family)
MEGYLMNKTILITGCSSGIGYAAAVLLKQRGYRVFAAARKSADVERLRQEGFESVQMDVNDSASIKQAIQGILVLSGGTLDAVFNNAGFLQAGAVEDVTREMDEAQFATNVFGAMEVVRQVLAVMRKQGQGRIIQNSSILGIIAMTMCGSYNASKFALEGYSNTLRQELRGTGIHVSIINPGPIKSNLRENAFQHFEHHLAQQQTGFHKNKYEKMKTSYFNPGKQDRALQLAPEAVVKKIIHALESSRPKAHYYVGFPAHLFAILRRLLPDCLLDWILIKVR